MTLADRPPELPAPLGASPDAKSSINGLPRPDAPTLRVETSELKSSYCNVANVNTTREEVILNFGVNTDWDRSGTGDVKLLHRIILSPHAAKRVAELMSRVMAEYEDRHGQLP